MYAVSILQLDTIKTQDFLFSRTVNVTDLVNSSPKLLC